MAIAHFLTTGTFWAVFFGALCLLLAVNHLRRGRTQYWVVWAEDGQPWCQFFIDYEQAEVQALRKQHLGAILHDQQNRIYLVKPEFAALMPKEPPSGITDPWPNASEMFSDSTGDVQAV